MRVRCCNIASERRCVEITRNMIAMILSIGTAMLAMNTMMAKGQEPDVQRYTTPLRIVSFSEPNSELVFITGSMFAGMYSTIAAIRNAHVRAKLAGLRS